MRMDRDCFYEGHTMVMVIEARLLMTRHQGGANPGMPFETANFVPE